MPTVEPLDDPDQFFLGIRNASAASPAEKPHLTLITPERKIMSIPSEPVPRIKEMKRLLPWNTPLQIRVIASTFSEPSMKAFVEAIPFAGFLFGFATAGHNVLIFEGHPDVFKQGVRWSDVLLIDSGMLPFLQSDWFEVATQVMAPRARILLHKREDYELHYVLGKSGDRADQIRTIRLEPGGETSYVNCLLTVMARGGDSAAEIVSGDGLPELGAMQLPDPEIKDWVSTLPFRHETLDSDKVMNVILRLGGRRWFHVLKSSWIFPVKVATSAGLTDALFSLSLTKLDRRRRKLRVERLSRVDAA
jgi:hypothetical protein